MAAPLPLVVDIPGPVVGKGRPRVVRRSNMPYPVAITPEKTVAAEKSVAMWLAQAWGRPPLDEPLSLDIEIRVPVPASKPKKFRAAALAGDILPVGKPDLDNVLKLIGDSGNQIIWSDDSRIAEITIYRRYSENPGMTITVDRASP